SPYISLIPLPPSSTLFPYTTLFRSIAEAIRSFLAHALLQVVGKADLAAVELAFGEGKPADHHIIGGRRAVATAPFPSRRLPTTGHPAHRYPPGADAGGFQEQVIHPDVIVLGGNGTNAPVQGLGPEKAAAAGQG